MVDLHPGVVVRNLDQDEHKDVQDVHFDIIITLLEAIRHQRKIMEPYVLSSHQHRTLIEEVEAYIKASPLLDGRFKYLEHQWVELPVEVLQGLWVLSLDGWILWSRIVILKLIDSSDVVLLVQEYHVMHYALEQMAILIIYSQTCNLTYQAQNIDSVLI